MRKINIFELLKIIQGRPGMFIIKKSIYNLIDFKSGYQFGAPKRCLMQNKFYKFQDYIIEQTIGMENRTDDCYLYYDCLLKVSSYSEEKAFDLFFDLLDKFIEENNIEINIDNRK